ncbi:MAG: preprotein translocase subunit YajC [Phycisphaeraceae bacterium]|nr:preprotein translocase subunit YajC [Phycisphaeraceae bacterium]
MFEAAELGSQTVWTLAQAGGGELVAPGNPASPGAATGPGVTTPGAGTTGAAGGGQGQTPGGFGGFGLLPVLMLAFLGFIIISSVMGQRKEKRKREAMMSSLSRHDRVQTIGGIIGTIVELKSDEVILKVDENSNTRIRFSRAAIQQVLKSANSGTPEQPALEVKVGQQQGAGV